MNAFLLHDNTLLMEHEMNVSLFIEFRDFNYNGSDVT